MKLILEQQIDRASLWQREAEELGKQGWTGLHVEYGGGRAWWAVIAWADENCGEYREHLGYWLFRNPADATWFRMRWL